MLVSKEFKFSYAHLLPHHEGKCRNLHGHNARMIVTVSGDVSGRSSDSSHGMVMDFGDLKKIVEKAVVNDWDHRFLACGDEWVCKAQENILSADEERDNIFYVGIRTTAENLSKVAFEAIESMLPEDVELVSIEFYETDSAFASYTKDDANGSNNNDY